MSTKHFKEFGDLTGFVFHGTYSADNEHVPIDLHGNGDRCLAVCHRAKAKGITLEQEWRSANWFDLELRTVRQFVSYLDEYKKRYDLVDFSDMLDLCDQPLDIDAVIVDEAQDLTVQQWMCAKRLGAAAKSVWIAGDDDQAVYGFSGADPRPLFSIAGERKVLPHSHRMPIAVKQLAESVARRIVHRVDKKFTPRNEQGNVSWVTELNEVDLSQGTWLLLARNRHQLESLRELARTKNVVYQFKGVWSNNDETVRAVLVYEQLRHGSPCTMTDFKMLLRYITGATLSEDDGTIDWNHIRWPFEGKPDWMETLRLHPDSKEYIRGLRRRGESLINPGRVVISTVHSAKGGEADNVLLLTDISRRVAETAIRNPDDENRVLYVALSRARHSLYLVKPTTRNFWNI